MKNLHGNKKIPFVYCSTCRKYQPAGIENWGNKKLKIECSLIYCVKCEYVQNLERIPKMKWIRYSELKYEKLN